MQLTNPHNNTKKILTKWFPAADKCLSHHSDIMETIKSLENTSHQSFSASLARIDYFLIPSWTRTPKLTSILSIAGGEHAVIPVCLGCFISGKSSMTHRIWTQPRTGWTNYSILDNVSNTNSHAKNSRLGEGKKTWLSIGCDHYNFLSGFLSKALHFKCFIVTK